MLFQPKWGNLFTRKARCLNSVYTEWNKYTLHKPTFKLIIGIGLFLILVSFQSTDFSLINSISTSASYFKTDNLENTYVIRKDVLEKYDREGKLFKTYGNKLLGEITSIDVSNPLNIILFYRNFSQIIFLDNTLSPKGDPLALENIGFQQPLLVCSSYNNALWLYNQQNSELIRLDQNLQTSFKTGNISRLLNMEEVNPNYLLEYNNLVFLNNPKVGILVFDIYGTYFKTIHLKGLNEFQIHGDHIFYYLDKKMKTYNLKTLEEQVIELPDSNAIAARIEKEKLFLLKPDHLDIYSIK